MEGSPNGLYLLDPGTVRVMLLIEVVAVVVAPHRLTDDQVTDLIETIIDDLDARSLEPSVGSARVDDDLEVTVTVAVNESEEFDALTRATSAVKTAFQSAGIGAAGMAIRNLRSRTMPLQPA